MNNVFSKLGFKKLTSGDAVAFNGNLAFRKLEVTGALIAPGTIPPIIGLTPNNFDLRIIGLSAGTYTITVTACAKGLEESEKSLDEILYTVK